MDGAGKWRRNKFIAFCGYVDAVERLELFKERWRAVLIKYGLTSLHYTEAMAWQGEQWQRLHREWGPEHRDARRAEALGEFIDAIRSQPTLKQIGVCADSGHVAIKAADAKRPELMLFEYALRLALEQLPPDETLSVLCDWEDGFDEMCLVLLRKLRSSGVPNAKRIVLIGFGDDEAYAELQAADMFAYLSCKELERVIERPSETPDPLYVQLTSHAPAPVSRVRLGELFDAETFARMIASHETWISSPHSKRGANRK